MKMSTIEEEAAWLAKRFHGVNRAAFARDYGISGGQAMIYQHITGLRPISLDAAQAYAQGFKCSLEEISPRLAAQVRKAVITLAPESEAHAESASQAYALTSEERSLVEGFRAAKPADRETMLWLAKRATTTARKLKSKHELLPHQTDAPQDQSIGSKASGDRRKTPAKGPKSRAVGYGMGETIRSGDLLPDNYFKEKRKKDGNAI